MINKDSLKAFVGLLDTASDAELVARKDLLQKVLRDQSLSRDAVADCRFLLRRLQEEQISRAERSVAGRFQQLAAQA